MKKKRVVVTGFSAITAIGDSWPMFKGALKTHKSAVRYMSAWDEIRDLGTKLAAPVDHFELPKHYTRKKNSDHGPGIKISCPNQRIGT